MVETAIVAGHNHAVCSTKAVIALDHIHFSALAEKAEFRRTAIVAMLARDSAKAVKFSPPSTTSAWLKPEGSR